MKSKILIMVALIMLVLSASVAQSKLTILQQNGELQPEIPIFTSIFDYLNSVLFPGEIYFEYSPYTITQGVSSMNVLMLLTGMQCSLTQYSYHHIDIYYGYVSQNQKIASGDVGGTGGGIMCQETVSYSQYIGKQSFMDTPGTYLLTIQETSQNSARTQTAIETRQITVVVKPAVQMGSIDVATDPSNAKVILDNVERGYSPLLLINVPIGSHTVRVEKTGYTSNSETVNVVAGQITLVGISLAPLSTTGTISVTTNPSASYIYYDNVYMGTSPITITTVPVGSHTIKATKAGYSDAITTVTVTAGTTVSASLTLSPISTPTPTPTTGTLSVDSTPIGASIFIDNVIKGTTNTVITLPTGSYDIKLIKVGYSDNVGTVTILSGIQNTYSAILQSTTSNAGSIQITSVPSGASVYINSNYMGTTPFTATSLSPGNHNVLLSLQDYNDYSKVVTVTVGQTTTVSVALTKLGSCTENSRTIMWLPDFVEKMVRQFFTFIGFPLGC